MKIARMVDKRDEWELQIKDLKDERWKKLDEIRQAGVEQQLKQMNLLLEEHDKQQKQQTARRDEESVKLEVNFSAIL